LEQNSAVQSEDDLGTGLRPFHRAPNERQIENLVRKRRRDLGAEAGVCDLADSLHTVDQLGSFVPLAHGGFPMTKP
jgi:hypothetical protein